MTRSDQVHRVVVYGDFNCPWSRLAAQRAARLQSAGHRIDWRAVEHDHGCASRKRLAVGSLGDEIDQVRALLLPEERLALAVAGFLPCTSAAVAAYAEGYGAGVAAAVRQLLFDAYWVDAVDIGDARVLRSLLVEVVRGGSSSSETLRDWGYAVDVTGGPITATGHELVARWKAEWSAIGAGAVPVVVVDGGTPLVGQDAVRGLGDLIERDAPVVVPPAGPEPGLRPSDLPDLSWTTQHGSRWTRSYQDAARAGLLPLGLGGRP